MAAEKLFGTDGMRGIPGEHPFVPDVVRRLAYAAGTHMDHVPAKGASRVALIARDTRKSGPGLEKLLAEGLGAAGFKTISVGVLPTPALSYLAGAWNADLAAMVSASHNPAEFNGIKFFRPDGMKLDPEQEADIERRVAETKRLPRKVPGTFGWHLSDRSKEARRAYLEFLRSTFPAELDLSGMTIVADTANGAASGLAEELLETLGAKVVALGDRPNGRNINLGCGALETETMRKAVVRHKADCGFSVDGDADRAMFSDETGRLLDGDAIVAYLTESLQRQGLLRGGKVVVTVMSNVGLFQHLKKLGVGAEQTAVGDRHVTQALMDGGYSLGGEASGHIIVRRFARTGDGLLTALQVLAELRRSREPLSRFRRRFIMYPQVLQNLPVERKVPLEDLPHFQALVKKHQRALGDKGRVFVRYSGTEPLLRLMAEGPKDGELRAMLKELAQAYRKDTERS